MACWVYNYYASLGNVYNSFGERVESHVGSDYKTGLDPAPNRMDLSIYLFWDHPTDFVSCAIE